jgi:WD40 repeat protein
MSTGNGANLAVDPTGKHVLVAGAFEGRVTLAPLAGGESRILSGLEPGEGGVISLAFSVDGRVAVAAGNRPALLRVWDLDSGKSRVIDPKLGHEGCVWEGGLEMVRDIESLPDGRFLTGGSSGVHLWDVESGKSQEIEPCAEKSWRRVAVSRDGRTLLVVDSNPDTRASIFGVHDLETGSFRNITSHGNRLSVVALDPTGAIVVTGDLDGVVRVGPLTGEEPHVLFGHQRQISSVAVSPDGKWIVSGSQDGTIRLWPMPDLSTPPLHTLPHRELLAKLRELTNLRVVPDAGSATGYKLEPGPFPGWARVPEW